MNYKKLKIKFIEIYNKEIQLKRQCANPDCSNTAIKTHYFSKSKILKDWASHGKLWILETNLSSFNNETKFKKRGIDEYPWLKFYGYCSDCDRNIFKPIEGNEQNIDFFNFKNQILVTLRGALKEYRKKENIINFQIKSAELFPPISVQKILIYASNQELKAGLNDIKFYHDSLLSMLYKNNQDFVFKTYKINKLPIGFSSILNFEDSLTLKTEILKSLLISLFPYQNNSFLVIGYLKKHEEIDKFLEYIENSILEGKIEYFISNLLMKNIEDWIIEPSFYNKISLLDPELILGKVNYFNKNTSFTILRENFKIDYSLTNIFNI